MMCVISVYAYSIYDSGGGGADGWCICGGYIGRVVVTNGRTSFLDISNLITLRLLLNNKEMNKRDNYWPMIYPT